jgi:site-specific DNA recombinase
MTDIEAGRIDCVVVYKVDRLSRSLLDFARIMGVFEKHAITFVSTTQQFDTSVPVGRLTLNLLLTFAQFEREIISERTRDKKAASRQRGQWIGGYLPLGYDLDPPGGRLVVNEREVQQVRDIFCLFEKMRSLEATLEEVNRRGWKRKSWITRKGVVCGGGPFTEGTLLRLLTNELYNGRVIYKGKRYRGEQAAIVGGRQWKNVQTILSRRIPKRGAERTKQGALLKGVLYCPSCNRPMQHTYTSRNEQRYRYYVCTKGEHGCRNRTAAVRLEASVLERLAEVAQNHAVLGKLVRMCAAQSMVSPELLARLHLWVERVTYSQKTGEVSIQLRTKEAKRHGIG